jgi:hypothetical protein
MPTKLKAFFVRLSVPLLCSGDMSDTDFAFFGSSFGGRICIWFLEVILMFGCPFEWLRSGTILWS